MQVPAEALKGFAPGGGLVVGALYDNEYYYMTFGEGKEDRRVELIMRKLDNVFYMPHNARDINGKQYDELCLNEQEPFCDFETPEQLLDFLRNPDPSRLEAQAAQLI